MTKPLFIALFFLALTLTPASSALRAGAAVTDITPELGVTLDGLLQKGGPITEILDPLRARCLVLDDGTTRLAIVVIDACIISGEVVERAKGAAQTRTGLPMNRILISATHTHMAPRIAGWTDAEIDRRYYDLVVERIADAVAKSIERLAPATMGWSSMDKPKYLANRRWIMKPGTVGPNPFGKKGDGAVMGGQPTKHRLKPAGPVDPSFTVLSLRHANGRPLALFANYGIHYGMTVKGVASADSFGNFPRAL
jgi:neutral ceramidase